MFPSRGCCHGVFLLSHAARLKKRLAVTDWVQAARERSTFMSKALQLDDIAQGMLGLGLAFVRDQVTLAGSLEGLSDRADTPTLKAIARLLFKAGPPSWIWFAVRDGKIAWEYVPSRDLEALAWIEPELEQMLLDAHLGMVVHEDDGFLKAMGEAAELVVLAALRYAGENPTQVSRLSDTYGYDIECPGTKTDRIEVKAASRATLAQFHISRNEFEKSTRYGPEWRLVQVVFSGKAFVSNHLDASHVETVRVLRQGVLQDLVPEDTPYFKWSESAQISPPHDAWDPVAFALDPDLSIRGFRKNGDDPALLKNRGL